jgi:hypothetical protein
MNNDYENDLNYIENNKNTTRQDVKSFTNDFNDLSDIKRNNKIEVEKVKMKKTQANAFENYIRETGISSAFQLILTELLIKDIKDEDYFSYAASRLRQIGRQVEDIRNKNNMN